MAPKVTDTVVEDWHKRIEPLIEKAVNAVRKAGKIHLATKEETHTQVMKVAEDTRDLPGIAITAYPVSERPSRVQRLAGAQPSAPDQDHPKIKIGVDGDGRIAIRTENCRWSPPDPIPADQFGEKQITDVIQDFVSAAVPRL